MSIDRRRHPLSDEGYALVIADARGLDSVETDVRAQIPDDVVALLADPARRLRDIAASASHPCVARLVEGIGERSPRVEVYVGDPADPWSTTDVIARFPRFPTEPWAVGLRGAVRTPSLPPSIPPALASFYSHFGGLDLQYGWSPVLFAPAGVRPVRDALAERGIQSDRATDDPFESAYAFYEVDGDLLCWLADGDAAWLGEEWADGGQPLRRGDVGSILTELFEHALRGERYHA